MLLFVYGTLRSTYDSPMAQLLQQHARLVGHGSVPGRLFDLGWYPGATYEPDSPYRVWGDVFELTDESVLHQLDEYEGIEGHPDDEYDRRDVPVQLTDQQGDTTQLDCQMYVFLKPTVSGTWIESGNYLARHD